MKDTGSPAARYGEYLKDINRKLDGLLWRKSRLGWIRLLTAMGTLAMLWTSWPLLGLFLPLVLIFLYVLRIDFRNRDAILHQERLRDICNSELQYLDHAFYHVYDGAAFNEHNHPYVEDLDIFGHASVYQLLNRANSEQGRRKVADWLKLPANADLIPHRQKAVLELSERPSWMLEFRAKSLGTTVTESAETNIRKWVAEEAIFKGRRVWTVVRWLVPMAALVWLFVFMIDRIETPVFLIGLAVFTLIAFSISRKVVPAYAKLNRVSPQLDTLGDGIACIETSIFQEDLLRQLHQRCHRDNSRASTQIHGLRRILELFDYRMNPLVYLPLNIFFLWDLQLALKLEAWKKDNRHNCSDWFDVLSEMEALVSLGTLKGNHPGWVFPSISLDMPCFEARGLHHPLILASKSVSNSFSTKGAAQLSLVTGSNMAGKSTFLRTIGVNMVLAAMGAPVAAESCTLNPCRVMSSMRIKDNLEESTSTFYAELKKLKAIIEAVNSGEQVFILLDEILRGTNSNDRRTGAMALIRQLIKQGATGIIATHDLELAELHTEFPNNLTNYHFDVQVSGAEMYFDYTLKPGICQSMNASILMKKIGIDLDS